MWMDLFFVAMALLPWIAECTTRPRRIEARVRVEAFTPAQIGSEAAPAVPSRRAPGF